MLQFGTTPEEVQGYDQYLDAQAIDNLSMSIYRDNVNKGFWEELSKLSSIENKEIKDIARRAWLNEKLLLVVTELSEGVEAIRKNLQSDHLENRSGIEEEVADTIIRLLDFCGGTGVKIGEVIFEKLEYNRSREFKHGKKF
jgi:NTP pyrophosphatase (non-canonical NTP hydrolase)